MDVPFISSGAMSRAQYSLVRKVENAESPQAADQILLNELDVIRRNLQLPHLSIRSCKECLILILHCAMSLSTANPGDLDFAFPHAVNLAELGQSPMDKKIGYIFCMELMPPDHELQLMLVNTLRKDLESTSVARICLALNVLSQVSNENVIPAVDARLQTLLEHESAAVRRRASMAYYTMFQQDAERLAHLEDMIEHHLRVEPAEIISLSTVVGKLKHSESVGRILNSRVQHQYRVSRDPSSVTGILRTLRRSEAKLDPGSVSVVLDIIKRVSKVPARALLRDAFMLLTSIGPDMLREFQQSSTAVTSIRHFLTSKDPNDLYLFMSCLSSLDPSVWAGTRPNSAAILDEWEVQQVMRLLDSPDSLIRKMTLGVLRSVDPTIVETYYSQALHNLSPSLSLSDKDEYVSRLYDIIDMQDGNDVDEYTRHLKDLFSTVEGVEYGAVDSLPVLDCCVQQILNRIRQRETSSRICCVTALAVCLTEPEVRVGPTLMVIISALVSEYCGKVSISPMEMLRGIATRLASYAPSVRDACLLTMLRLSVECDDVPEEVAIVVRRLSKHSGTHLRRRCDQFLTLSTQRHVLSDIISRAPSSSVRSNVTISNYQSNQYATAPRTTPSGGRDSLGSLSPRGMVYTRRLRYDAYAAPQPIPSLRHLSSPRRLKSSASSPEGNTKSLSRATDASNSLNELVKVEGSVDTETNKRSEIVTQRAQDDLASRVDLIVLDSPFTAELTKDEKMDPDFRDAWDSMENSNVRGWCEASLDKIVHLLQSLQYRMRVIATDQPPFEGELKVLVQGSVPQQYATLRLREGEDESCLWRLRCDDPELRTTIKRLMEDM